MKLKLAFASLLVLSACGSISGEARQALELMRLDEGANANGIHYASMSGSGNDVTLNDVTLVMAGEPGQPAQPVVGAGALKLTGLGVRDGKPVVGGVVFTDITPKMSSPGMPAMSLGSVGIEGMDEVTGKFVASTFTEQGPGEVPAFEQWKFGKLSLNNLTVAGPIPQEEGEPGSVKIEVGEISVSNLDNMVLGLARLAGLKGEVSVPGAPPIAGKFDFGKFDVTNLQTKFYVDMFSTGMAQASDPDATPDYAAMFQSFTSPLDPLYDKLDWTGAAVDVSGLRLDASQMVQTVTRNAEGVAVALDTPRYTIKLTADSSGGQLGAMGLMVLAMTGYDSNEIAFYSGGKATFDPAKDLTRWADVQVGIENVLDIKMDAGIVGLKEALPTLFAGFVGSMETMGSIAESAENGEPDEDAIEMATQQMAMTMIMGMLPLQLTDLDISITDKKLVALILNQTASQAGQSLDAYRGDLVAMVSGSAQFMIEAGVDPAIANEATSAVAGFLSKPGTLRIQLKPQQPLGVMTAMMMPITKESLGFSMTFVPAN
jgi:hypothetical protein